MTMVGRQSSTSCIFNRVLSPISHQDSESDSPNFHCMLNTTRALSLPALSIDSDPKETDSKEEAEENVCPESGVKDMIRREGNLLVDETLRLIHSDDWTDCGVIKGIKVQRKEFPKSENRPPCVKGSLNFGTKFSAHDFIDFLRDFELKGKWDDQFADGKCLEEFDYNTAVIWMMFKGVMMYDPRDFVQFCYTKQVDPHTLVQVAKSTTTFSDRVGETKRKAVRANLHNGSFVCETLSDGSLKVTFMMQADLKVKKVPYSVLARMGVFLEQPAVLLKMQKAINKYGVTKRQDRPTN